MSPDSFGQASIFIFKGYMSGLFIFNKLHGIIWKPENLYFCYFLGSGGQTIYFLIIPGQDVYNQKLLDPSPTESNNCPLIKDVYDMYAMKNQPAMWTL